MEEEKIELHPRNRNRKRYNLDAMVDSSPELTKHLRIGKGGAKSINFSDPYAVRILNQAILKHYYGIEFWELPKNSLCPPIPGRAEYIHHIADLLSKDNIGKAPIGESITCLDIGTGASCIYPIIGIVEYKWNFIASDINAHAIKSAQTIINSNHELKNKVDIRLQKHAKQIFKDIIRPRDLVDITICNPPFHGSEEEALKGTKRKIKGLTGRKIKSPKLNFGGDKNELIYEGGEYQFIQNMIGESKEFSQNCLWFSTLVSKKDNLKRLQKSLEKTKPNQIEILNIKTGNKLSRVLAWTYHKPQLRRDWFEKKR